MAIYSTRAIVIGRHNIGEADRIMVLLTPEKGVIRGVAKGVRRIKSRMAGHLELFSESELMLAEGRNMDTITSARLQHHMAINDDYDRMRLAYLFSEMVNRLGAESEHHEGLFKLMHDTYDSLAKDPPDQTIELWFKLNLLDRLGYRPELRACMICQTSDGEREHLFNPELGGIVDMGCSSPGNHPMTKDQIKLWRLMQSHPLSTIRQVKYANDLAKATLRICDAFYDYTFGKRFRSAEVLN